MDWQWVIQVAATVGAVWGVVRVELRWLRRDVDLAHKRIDRHEDRFHGVQPVER